MAIHFPTTKTRSAAAVENQAKVYAVYTIHPQHSFEIPNHIRLMRVMNGNVWVAAGGKDYILLPGDTLSINADDHATVVPLRKKACMIELLQG
jgi:hypothetical protein